MRGSQILYVFWIPFFICLMLSSSCLGYGNLQFKDDQGNTADSLWDGRCYDSVTFPEGISWLMNDWDPNEVFDFNLSDFQSIASDSFETWESVPDANVAFVFGGFTGNFPNGDGTTHDLPPSPALDGDNIIGFDDLPVGALGITYIFTLSEEFTFDDGDLDPNNDTDFGGTDPNTDIMEGTYPAGTILDADILLNKDITDWSVTGEREKYDIQAILVHEIGHFIGLCHSCVRETFVSQATMFPFAATNPEGLEQRTLSADDIAGISSYYSSPTAATNFGSISGSVAMNLSAYHGAHLWAVKIDDREIIVGVYSDVNGNYSLEGLLLGDYILRVEPISVDELRINETFPIGDNVWNIADFQAHFYGGGAIESSTPTVSITAGTDHTGYDFTLVDGSTPDPFEDDNSFDQAHPLIPDGPREIHHFYPVGDEDFFSFYGIADTTYLITTSNITIEQIGSFSQVLNSDTVITLYGSDRETILSRNNNLSQANSRLESYILFTCERSDQYYFMVQDYSTTSQQTPGGSSNYDIMIETINPNSYYVDGTDGSDITGEGSQLAPWQSIQHAIDTAEGTQNNPLFINIAAGTYPENITCNRFEFLLGGFDPNGWIRDPDMCVSTLDGGGLGSVVIMADAMTIDGFTIRNGNAARGGGCYASGVSGHISNNYFENNVSTMSGIEGGGAICILNFADCFVCRNTFSKNSALGGGAIAYSNAEPYICYNHFRNNTADYGGAISIYHPNYNISGYTVDNQFFGNSATNKGGAIDIVYAHTDVFEKNIFVMNTATLRGGAMSVYNSVSQPIMTKNIFASNHSLHGGAFYMDCGRPVCDRNIFVGNISTDTGGAFDISRCHNYIRLFNNIFVGNQGGKGGALYWHVNDYGDLINNTFMENTALTNGGAVYVNNARVGNFSSFDGNVFYHNIGGAIHEANENCDGNVRNNDFAGNFPGEYYDHDIGAWCNDANAINTDVDNSGRIVENNADWSAGFKSAPSGTVDSIAYDPNTYQSILTDSDASFEPNALAGLTIDPNTEQYLHFYIVSNTETTITTWGDMTSVAEVGSEYKVFDFHLAKDSSNINAGMDVSAYVEADIDGQARPLYGAFDIGADEVFPIAGDFEPDEDVDIVDLKFFFDYWLDTCISPAWCDGCDVNLDGAVDLKDYNKIAAHWLQSAP